MILQSLSLQDFGLYAGSVEIALAPQSRSRSARPIVLIGGKNGAGKTSLLDSVRLALYGRLALGGRISQAEYEKYLREKIHQPKVGGHIRDQASVALEFDYAEAGEIHRYRVVRSWTVRGQSVSEVLELRKNGELVSSVPKEEWHNFLQDLLPFGVSQLFFFDGEKIKEIAEDGEDDQQLANAVRSLLGIDLIGKLRTDLGFFITRHDDQARAKDDSQLEDVVRSIERIERELEDITQGLADVNTQLESAHRVAEAAKRRFVSKGGDVAVNRGRLEAELALLNDRLAILSTKLRNLSGGLLPLMAAPKLMEKVSSRLKDARAFPILPADVVTDAISQWRKTAPEGIQRRWTSQHWRDLGQLMKMSGAIHEKRSKSGHTNLEISSVLNAFELITEAVNVTGVAGREAAVEFLELSERRLKIEESLARIDAVTTDFLYAELRETEQKVGMLLHMQSEEIRKRDELVVKHNNLARLRKTILSQQASATYESRRVKLAGRISRALINYERRLIEHKTSQLERSFMECFRRLARKGDLVRTVTIDPTTFHVVLLDGDGRQVNKQRLSAGEKQIYAIAMLWSLAKTSGRSLPMIIDTPLGRLDSEHRENVLRCYLPDASHQVIVLATDTEIDAPTFRALEPHVSHSYLLEFSQDEQRTLVSPGYFQALKAEFGARRAL